MNRVLAPRASTILYNLLVARADPRPYLLPANICPIVPITFLKAERPFEFVDISPFSLAMESEPVLERARLHEIGGVLYSHPYGYPSTPHDLFSELKQLDPSLLMIDDRCLCAPDLEPDSSSVADVLLYSTGYAKIVDLGFGGYAYLSEELLYRSRPLPFDASDLEELEKAYKAAVDQREPFQYHDSNWLQTEPDPPSWDIYRGEIERVLPETLRHRREINAIYSASLPADTQFSPDLQMWRFQIRVPNQKGLLRQIFAAGLFASAHYASLAGIMAPGDCPEADRLAGQVVNLFNDHHYTTEMAHRTVEIILGAL